MFSVTVRDHMLIAHSLPRETFGPAQKLHGATYVVDAAFYTADLDDDGLAVDIAKAADALKAVVGALSYQNLDDLAVFAGKVTTTEVIARHVFDALVARIGEGALGTGGERIRRLKVDLHESHVATASYEADL